MTKSNSSISPDVDKDRRIQKLENENRQLKLQLSALSKGIDRLNAAK